MHHHYTNYDFLCAQVNPVLALFHEIIASFVNWWNIMSSRGMIVPGRKQPLLRFWRGSDFLFDHCQLQLFASGESVEFVSFSDAKPCSVSPCSSSVVPQIAINALMSPNAWLRPLAGGFAKSFSPRFNVRVSDQGLDQPSWKFRYLIRAFWCCSHCAMVFLWGKAKTRVCSAGGGGMRPF